MRTALETKFGKVIYTSANRAKISYFINKKVSDKLMVEELTSEVFAKAWNYFDRYNSEVSKPLTWLSTIAKSVIIDYTRKRNAKLSSISVNTDFLPKGDESSEIDYTNSHADNNSPEKLVCVSERILEIKSKLAKISNPKVQLVMNEFYFNDKKIVDISEEFNIPLNSVKVYLKRGIEELQENISHKLILA